MSDFHKLFKKTTTIGCYNKTMYDEARKILDKAGYTWGDIAGSRYVGELSFWNYAKDDYTCLIVYKNGTVSQAAMPNPEMTALEFIDKYEEMKELEEEE